ncbi:hypothetical protein HPB48_015807 [Haemaphysalis longicornis]|uniref:DDE-1 domain-containing protein n=1 Tax=Haemaphysalis longicornis TaxID=44386 RepID=A0A9J6G820_HAELO|nr:hypothetical protein HPB48_015807 [Haemaphysalis longicornis]
MTRALFTEWLMELDDDMVKKNRKICLLVDNCSDNHVEGSVLRTSSWCFFQPTAPHSFRPPEQGIIRSAKCAYRKCLIEEMLFNLHLKREKTKSTSSWRLKCSPFNGR